MKENPLPYATLPLVLPPFSSLSHGRASCLIYRLITLRIYNQRQP
ncbi:MAG: hypothetical protein AB8W34_01010 [Coxiella endosymbiont of Dermacentor silvarum]